MSETNNEIVETIVKKPRGRRPKSYYLDLSNSIIEDKPPEIKEKKKRGRRSKGGKIVEVKNIFVSNIPVPNIILHLRCRLSDINNFNSDIVYEPDVNAVDNFTFDNNLQFNYIEDTTDMDIQDPDFNKCNDNIIRKNISIKLKQLSHNLKHSNIMKRSDCFWCTYPFNNDPIYIPKFELNSEIHCYGNFCSPECACAHLMDEHLDTSVKFERYYLLNNIYSKIYNYNKNIKPAPNPYYLLDKYMGNLDILEYRKLLQHERLLLVVEKPLTQVLPEIYEENPDFLINSKIVSKSKKTF